ncbi:HRDC domain-containing protein [uncultured Ruminococcus sp.]|uniref:HRDC domain-containing protein n=1 Tax=uncultured Ruminococcus sp. TaxID=165186 RepID=UPI0025D882DE|nr:HRDC domain-containing protein [uncultured Ruminococcus sp.]
MNDESRNENMSYTAKYQLEEIIKTNPQTLEELKSIKGFGDAKCLKYGKDILMILGDY